MAKEKATPVDERLEEQMSQKMEKDFDGHDWYGSELNADPTPIIDPASGKPVILRVFEFRFDPKIKKAPSKQELFSSHSKQVMTLLWSDGLRPIEGVNPRVAIDMKRRTYRIVVVAEARLNTTIIEKPNSLNDLLRKKK